MLGVAQIGGVQVDMAPNKEDENVKPKPVIKRHKSVMLEEDAASEPTVSSDSDDAPSESKKRNFEFTSNVATMKLVRAFVFLQVIALILDHPSARLPPLFRSVCKGLFYYTIRFYSRPFLDLIYIINYFIVAAQRYVRENLPSTPNGLPPINYDIPSYRRLQDASSLDVSIVEDRAWHEIRYFSHFVLGMLFAVMAVLLTLRLWKINDYTDRKEVRHWIKNNVADGWWRRGALHIVISMAKALLFTVGFLLVIHFITSQSAAFPDTTIVLVILAICASILFIIWLLGFCAIRAAENSFVRYVSQNVNYTSTIILKRVIKAKVELGIALMLIIFMPVLYSWLQGIIGELLFCCFYALMTMQLFTIGMTQQY